MKAISIPVANNTQPVRYYPHGLPDRSPKDMEDDEKEEVLMTLSFDETKHDDNAFDTFLSQCFEEPVPRKFEEDTPAERSQSPCLSLLGDEFDDKDVNTTLPISPILQAKECMMLVMMQEMSAVDSKSDTIVENSFHNSVDDDSTAFLPRLNISLSMEPNSVASITAPDDETDLLINHNNHDEVKKPSPLSLQMPTLSCKSLDSAWITSTDSQDQQDTARDTARDTVHSLNSSVTTTSTLSRPGSARGRTQLICTQALQRAQSISTALSTAFIEHQHQQVEQAQERKRLVAEKQQRKLKIQEREEQLLKKKQALLANAKQAKGFDSASFDHQQQQGKTQSTTTTPLKTLPTTSLKSVSYDSYHPSKTSSSSSSSSPSIVPSSSSSSITSIATATTGLRSRSVSPATITKRLSPPSSTSSVVSHKKSIMTTMTLPSSSGKVVKPVAMVVPKTKRSHSHDVDDEDTGKSTVVKTVYPRSIVAKQKEIVVKIPLHCATNATTSNTRK